MGIYDGITVKPSGLVVLFDVFSVSPISDLELITMFGDPLLSHVVEQSWDDIEALLDQGIGLKGKSLVRLRWDVDHGIHDLLRTVGPTDDERKDGGKNNTSLGVCNRIWVQAAFRNR